jgi:hypothetical protein
MTHICSETVGVVRFRESVKPTIIRKTSSTPKISIHGNLKPRSGPQ